MGKTVASYFKSGSRCRQQQQKKKKFAPSGLEKV